MMNSYDITVKNNTETGNVRIRIVTHYTFTEDQLDKFSALHFSDVQRIVQNLYNGNVVALPWGTHKLSNSFNKENIEKGHENKMIGSDFAKYFQEDLFSDLAIK